MDSPRSRTLILFFTALFSASTLFLAVVSLHLHSKNASLAAEAKRLRSELDSIDQKHRSLLENIENERNHLKEALDAVKKDQESIQADLVKAQTEASSANEEKVYLEDILIHKTKEIEGIKSGTPGASPLPSGVPDDIRQKDEEIRRLSEQNRLLLEKLEKFYKTTNEKISEINVAKIALEETVTEARRKIDDEWNTVNLGSISVDKNGQPLQGPPRREAKQEGRVLAVNEENGFIVVDLGRIDNIRSDSKLEVKKNGKPIATLSVLEIRDAMSAYNVQSLQDGQKIQVNDLVGVQH